VLEKGLVVLSKISGLDFAAAEFSVRFQIRKGPPWLFLLSKLKKNLIGSDAFSKPIYEWRGTFVQKLLYGSRF